MPIVDIEPQMSPPYQVVIEAGALSRVSAWLPATCSRVVVVTDSNVGQLYGLTVGSRLRSAELDVDVLTFPAGEEQKTRATKSRLEDEMVSRGVGRDAVIVALGGGVTTDIAGFLAATYMRGLPFLSVPTTLLAMVDAALGGKTGVNHPNGKNLIGVIHQPEAVIIDPDTLKSLPDRDFDCGLAEMVKHALVADPSYLDSLVKQPARLRGGDPDLVVPAIVRSVEIKAAIVARDELETGERAVLNLGHTVGHAIERVTRFSVSHGHAVAVGIVAEARLAREAGALDDESLFDIEQALSILGFPALLPDDVAPDAVISACDTDKKNRAGDVRYVQLARVGEPAQDGESWTHKAPLDVLRSVLEGMT